MAGRDDGMNYSAQSPFASFLDMQTLSCEEERRTDHRCTVITSYIVFVHVYHYYTLYMYVRMFSNTFTCTRHVHVHALYISPRHRIHVYRNVTHPRNPNLSSMGETTLTGKTTLPLTCSLVCG